MGIFGSGNVDPRKPTYKGNASGMPSYYGSRVAGLGGDEANPHGEVTQEELFDLNRGFLGKMSAAVSSLVFGGLALVLLWPTVFGVKPLTIWLIAGFICGGVSVMYALRARHAAHHERTRAWKMSVVSLVLVGATLVAVPVILVLVPDHARWQGCPSGVSTLPTGGCVTGGGGTGP